MEEEEFAAATKCHICQKYFTEDDVRVRDHCHSVILQENIEARQTINVIEALD